MSTFIEYVSERVQRVKGSALLLAVSLALLFLVKPDQLGVVLLKVNLMGLATVFGYFADREIFPYARPADLGADHPAFASACLRRAVIVGASLMAAALAL